MGTHIGALYYTYIYIFKNLKLAWYQIYSEMLMMIKIFRNFLIMVTTYQFVFFLTSTISTFAYEGYPLDYFHRIIGGWVGALLVHKIQKYNNM